MSSGVAETGDGRQTQIETPRLRLVSWHARHHAPFAALCADAEVMRHLGGPLDAAASLAKLAEYAEAAVRDGTCRWAVETQAGAFLGCAGVMRKRGTHRLGPHCDVGWRLVRAAWGHGYATEAAGAALSDFFDRHAEDEVLAYTAPDNARSQAVMARLGLRRDPARDFSGRYGPLDWHGLVWVADRSLARSGRWLTS